jgi:phosphate transport system permease protein
MKPNDQDKKKPFVRRFSRERIQETIMFGLLRSMTFFVLFCTAFLFWDILSKGSTKIFEGDGLINWEFLTEDPQTLHVIKDGETEIKLSSKKYYKLKDEKMLQKWNAFKQSKDYDAALERLNLGIKAIRKEWTEDGVQKAKVEFIARERESSLGKFSFWKELAADPKTTASDFELEIEKVPETISQFILGHLERERGRLAEVEGEIRHFRAKYYPLIENPTEASIPKIESAYLDLLEELPTLLTEATTNFGREVQTNYSSFIKTGGPKAFANLAEAIEAYGPIRQSLLGKNGGQEAWDEMQACLAPFRQSMEITLPSKDYAYSGGGIFPAIIGTLLLVLGAMLIAIVLGVFCAIFLAEYGKSGKFLSLVRLAILNLAGVPSIIFGLFGFGLFVIFLDWNVSLLAGWFTLAFMVLPVVITASEEALRSIPQGFRESSLALGATKWTMIRTSVLPYAMPGILTSSILGVARAAGETAPIMFTAAYAKRSELPWEGLENWTDFFFQGVMALPYHIYVVSAKIPQNAYTAEMQYGTAFVFLVLVLGVASSSILLRNRLRKKYRW